jgi:hypothetical protein
MLASRRSNSSSVSRPARRHLRREQLLLEGGIVVQLGIGRSRELVQHEPQTADQKGIEDEHYSNAEG